MRGSRHGRIVGKTTQLINLQHGQHHQSTQTYTPSSYYFAGIAANKRCINTRPLVSMF